MQETEPRHYKHKFEIPSGEIHLDEPFNPFRVINIETFFQSLKDGKPVEPVFTIAGETNWKIRIWNSILLPQEDQLDWDRFLRKYNRSFTEGKVPIITSEGIKIITLQNKSVARKTWGEFPIKLEKIVIDSINEEFSENEPVIMLTVPGDIRQEYIGVIWHTFPSVIYDQEIWDREERSVELGLNYAAVVDVWQTTPPYQPLPEYEKGLEVWLPNDPAVLKELQLIISKKESK